MEPIFLTCMVIAFFLTKGKVDTAAYASGKESPAVAKARMRHETGGGGRSTSGKPKGKGAFRLMLADRWANACEASRERGAQKSKRRRAWYEAEVAPRKDEAWKEKQRRKLDKADAARARWAQGRGLIDLTDLVERKAEHEAWKENERRNVAAGQPSPGTAPAADDPLHPADAAELDWFARQNPELARQADEQARAEGGRDGALWYDAVREARDAAAAADPAGREPTGSEPAAPATESGPVGKSGKESDSGCVWIPEGKSGPCGDKRHNDLPYCAKHHLIGRLKECGWSRDNRAEPRCPNKRVPHQPYCEAHEAEHARRTKAVDDNLPSKPDETPSQGEPTGNTASPPPAPSAPKASSTPPTEGNSNVYQQAVTRLIAAADAAAAYRADLASFADTLGGKKWGIEVTGPIQDMDGQLAALEGEYRDLAGQMKHQGDQGAAAHEQAPWVPADDSILV